MPLGSTSENVSLTAMLPEMLRLGTGDWAAAAWIESTFRFAVQESTNRQPDSGAALARLADLVFFEVVRRYFALHPQSRRARVAYESGYESESAFNRASRRMYGAPPAAWRRSMMGQTTDPDLD